jgi:hypothetical protein
MDSGIVCWKELLGYIQAMDTTVATLLMTGSMSLIQETAAVITFSVQPLSSLVIIGEGYDAGFDNRP